MPWIPGQGHPFLTSLSKAVSNYILVASVSIFLAGPYHLLPQVNKVLVRKSWSLSYLYRWRWTFKWQLERKSKLVNKGFLVAKVLTKPLRNWGFWPKQPTKWYCIFPLFTFSNQKLSFRRRCSTVIQGFSIRRELFALSISWEMCYQPFDPSSTSTMMTNKLMGHVTYLPKVSDGIKRQSRNFLLQLSFFFSRTQVVITKWDCSCFQDGSES